MTMNKSKLPSTEGVLVKNIIRAIDRNLKYVHPEWRILAIREIQKRLEEWRIKP